MSNTGNIPFNWNEEQDSNLFPDFSLNANANSFDEALSAISKSGNGMFSNSPFGANWEKRLPDWALPYFGEARVIGTSNLKFVDNTKIISQNKVDNYNSLLGIKVKPYKYTIYISKENADGDEVLKLYNNPDIKPGPDEVFVFMELDDDKLDLGKIVRVKLGANVIKDLQDKFFEKDLDADDLAFEIIRKIRLLNSNNKVVKDVNNSEDFEKLLIRAIEYEFDNKKFDEFSWFLFFINGVEFLGFKTQNWVSSITDWLREKKYEEEKYWNGHLEKGYAPPFLPDFLFNKTREEKEQLINKMINQPLELIDKLLGEKFEEKNALSDFIKPKLLIIKSNFNDFLKPYGFKMLELVDIVEGGESILQFYNALWVGVWNGIIEFIAGFIDLLGLLVLVLKQEVGFRITDALWEKIEESLNFVIYDTRDFLDVLLDKTITLAYDIYYLDFNGYKLAKNIGELVPDILTFYVSWLKASKLAKVNIVATSSEEIVSRELIQRIENESIDEVRQKAVREVEEKLDDMVNFDFLHKWDDELPVSGIGYLGGSTLRRKEIKFWINAIQVLSKDSRLIVLPKGHKLLQGNRAGFNPFNGNIYVQKGLTDYEIFHEYKHLEEYVKLGKDQYLKGIKSISGSVEEDLIRTYKREKYVFDEIMKNKNRFNQAQLKDAQDYFSRIIQNCVDSGIDITKIN